MLFCFFNQKILLSLFQLTSQMIIGVLGPEGSYSERAAKLWMLKNGIEGAALRYFEDIEDAFFAAAGGKTDLSVIPIENSIEGSVGVTLDLLREAGAVITGEVVVRIEHCLLSKGGPEDIRVILSHPQALAQCRHFLKTNFPHAELRSTGSTSHAARLAGEFEEMAAIASPEAAEKYWLRVLLSNVQDRKENHTRFIVVQAEVSGKYASPGCKPCEIAGTEPGKDPGKELRTKSGREPDKELGRIRGKCKTSLIVYLAKDRPGALYELLGAFAERGINLTKIESRPSKRELGDYYFYIDFEGSASDALIKDALEDINL